LSVVMGYDGV